MTSEPTAAGVEKTILHVSDLHFGPPYLPDRGEAVHEVAAAVEPDLVVVSGDFTQRAKERQFREAAEYLGRFAPPVVTTPGNHDVPLYRIHERVLWPYRGYRRHISPELDSVHRQDGLTVVALNSSRRFTLDNGKLTSDQLEFARRAYAETPDGHLRVMVTHHHLAPPPGLVKDRDVMPGARRALERFTEMGVHLLLAGHMHRSYIGDSLDFFPEAPRDRGIVIVQCGTTTSERGRGRERFKNSLNVIRACRREVFVSHYLWRGSADTFSPHSEHRFGVRPDPWLDTG